MKYYVMTIEQYTAQGAEAPTEQAKVEKKNTLDRALSYFYGTLKTVADSAAHNYLDIKIFESNGGCVKKDVYGAYINPDTTQGE